MNNVIQAFASGTTLRSLPKPARMPRVLVERPNPHHVVAALRSVFEDARVTYERGVPVQLHFDQMQGGYVAHELKADDIVLLAHQLCRPYTFNKKGEEVDTRLPLDIARMYLGGKGQWSLPMLNGIASSALLMADGSINCRDGYDPVSGMWCENMPDLSGLVPSHPSQQQAERALQLIRDAFKTFCFGDAATINDRDFKVPVVDISRPPGRDESSFLNALLTAACRPSLALAPGVLVRAAPMSGAGAGKGLLARCMCIIAFGRQPHAVTSGTTPDELEKRIAAELMQGGPALFIDNLNNTSFKSDLLASAITERPARVRLLGKSQMMPLNASALVMLTGNGLAVSEDLARRFITVELDPRTEDPEARPFESDIILEVTKRRTELLAAALTIWRWGRLAPDLKLGITLGSFEQWGRWVRDPLLALGCPDPAERVQEAKKRDPRRAEAIGIVRAWWHAHQDDAISANELHSDVQYVMDPHGRGRQFVLSKIQKLVGTRIGGFVLTIQMPAGKWGAAKYSLQETDGA